MKKILITLSFCLFASLAMQAQDSDASTSTVDEAAKARTEAILKQKRKEYQERKKANNKAVQKTTPASTIKVDETASKKTTKPKAKAKAKAKRKEVSKEELEKQTAEKMKKQDQ